jgi:hypothetical protein
MLRIQALTQCGDALWAANGAGVFELSRQPTVSQGTPGAEDLPKHDRGNDS